MEIIKASLVAALQQSGGGSSSTLNICDWVKTLPTMTGGAIANNYHYLVKYGVSEIPAMQYYYHIGDSSTAEYAYTTKETYPYEFYICVYDNDDNLKSVFKSFSGEVRWKENTYQTYRVLEPGYYYRHYPFCDKEETMDMVYASTFFSVNYTPSTYQSGNVTCRVSGTVNETVTIKTYDWDYDNMERRLIDTTTDTHSQLVEGTFTSNGWTDTIYSPLTFSDYLTFMDEFAEDIILYLRNH